MKRILLAFDGAHFSQPAFEFIQQMNEAEPVHVVGFFLPAPELAELLYSYGGVPAGPLYLVKAISADDTIVKKNIGHFKELCKRNGISYSVEADKSRHAISAVKEETKFADLLVMDGGSMYKHLGEDAGQEYVSSILHGSACPVIVIPGANARPRGCILAYDGSDDAIFAIKQFRYLLPYLSSLPALLIFFGNNADMIPNRKEAENLFGGYFPDLTITKLNLSNKTDIGHWIGSDHNAPIVVVGAKGRSAFSELFRKSFVEVLLREHASPLFVAHH